MKEWIIMRIYGFLEFFLMLRVLLDNSKFNEELWDIYH